MELFQVFNLPADQRRYPDNRKELWTQTGRYLGQALGGFSRLLKDQEGYTDQTDTINELQEELEDLRRDHTRVHKELHLLKLTHGKLHNEHDELQMAYTNLQEESLREKVEQEVHDTLLKNLQGELAEMRKETQDLRALATNMAEERTLLLEDKTEQSKKTEALRLENTRLAAEILEKDHVAEVNTALIKSLKEENIIAKDEIQGLKEDNSKLKAEATDLVAKARPLIIEEYRRSEELKEAVVGQFGKGYAYAKSRVAKAGVNPITVGLSSDEDVSDEEGGPSGT